MQTEPKPGYFVSDPRAKGGRETLLTTSYDEAAAHKALIDRDLEAQGWGANYFPCWIYEDGTQKTWMPR